MTTFSTYGLNEPTPLTEANIEVLQTVIAHFNLEDHVAVAETLHGHIAKIRKAENRFVPGSEGTPGRIDKEDMLFLVTLPGVRWFEYATDCLTLGFEQETMAPLSAVA